MPDLVNQDLYDDGGYAPYTDTQFVFQNNCNQAATITDIWVSKSCQPSLDGAIFVGQADLSGPSPADKSVQLGFDLDSPNPEAMWTSGWNVNQWTQAYDTGPLDTIPPEQARPFDIRAIALHVACQFSIKISVLYDRKTVTETFNDDGQPFRVSAFLPGVLKSGRPGYHPFVDYGVLYVGSAASPWHDDTWERENPSTWQLVIGVHRAD